MLCSRIAQARSHRTNRHQQGCTMAHVTWYHQSRYSSSEGHTTQADPHDQQACRSTALSGIRTTTSTVKIVSSIGISSSIKHTQRVHVRRNQHQKERHNACTTTHCLKCQAAPKLPAPAQLHERQARPHFPSTGSPQCSVPTPPIPASLTPVDRTVQQ